MAELNLKPELRFPEFADNWIEKKLGSICNHISYGLTVRPRYIQNGVPLISAREIVTGIVDIEKAPQIGKEDFNKLSDKAKPQKNDIFISKTGTVGLSAWYRQDRTIAITQNVAVIRFNNPNNYLPSFLIQYLKTHQFIKEAISKVNQSTIMDLQLGDIRKLIIAFPNPEEQQKIATFLAAVDQRIQLLQKKKAKLEEYKKGVMQKLFSQEIRFKDENGNDFPDWEEKKLGDLYEFKTTNSLSREKLNYENGNVKNIHYGDIHTKFKSHFDISNEKVPFINHDIELSKIKEENYLQEGDLVIADASEDYADIGKSIEIVSLLGEKVVAGLHTFLARRKGELLVIGFGGYMLKSFDIRLKIMRIAQGTKVLGISTSRLIPLNVSIPSLPEQQKIVSFLTLLDGSIESIGEEIEGSKAFKKGLLQKMFV